MTTDTFPKIETHIWWWIYFPMKFRTFISLATPWRMNLVLFFNAPLRVAVILLVGLWAGVAESNCFIAVLTLLPQGEGARQGGWGVLECWVVKLSPTVCDYSRSPNRRGEFSMILDSATSPFGFAQNDKGEFFLTIVKYIRRGWRWWRIYYYIDLYLTAKTCTQGQWGISDRGDFWSQRKLFIYKTIYLMTGANFQQ